MSDNKTKIKIIAVGSVYLETNYLGVETGGKDVLTAGKEYRGDMSEVRLGGSVVNFSTQVVTIGGEVSLIGKTGKDDFGEKLISLLNQVGIKSDLIVKDNAVQTSTDVGVVLKHSGQNIQIVAGNANSTLNINDVKSGIEKTHDAGAIYFGGFFKQDNLYKEYEYLCKSANALGLKVLLDPGRVPVVRSEDKILKLIQTLKYVDIYFPNEEEILTVTGLKSVDEAANRILMMGPKLIVVKLGKNGAVAYDGLNKYKAAGIKVEALTTVGAGDCFNAAFTVKYFETRNVDLALKYAVTASAIKVSQNTQPTRGMIEALISNG